ncbi:hypothetical protein XELAEV_18002893mg, partial [Xenopus laevis]
SRDSADCAACAATPCCISNAASVLRHLFNSPDTSSITRTLRSRAHRLSTPIHFLQNSGLDLPIVGTLRILKPRGIRFER